jgi:hypothetical protein
MLVRRLLFILSIVLAGVVAQYDLSENSTLLWCSKVLNTKQICYVNAHRYGYCEEGVTCNTELQICSGKIESFLNFFRFLAGSIWIHKTNISFRRGKQGVYDLGSHYIALRHNTRFLPTK